MEQSPIITKTIKHKKQKLQEILLKTIFIFSILLNVVLTINLSSINLYFIEKKEINRNTSENIQEIINNLKKIFIFPSERYETGTITNVNKLKEQFPGIYQNAQDGDYIIIFPDRMVIYRYTTNQIVNIAYIVNNTQNE